MSKYIRLKFPDDDRKEEMLLIRSLITLVIKGVGDYCDLIHYDDDTIRVPGQYDRIVSELLGSKVEDAKFFDGSVPVSEGIEFYPYSREGVRWTSGRIMFRGHSYFVAESATSQRHVYVDIPSDMAHVVSLSGTSDPKPTDGRWFLVTRDGDKVVVVS